MKSGPCVYLGKSFTGSRNSKGLEAGVHLACPLNSEEASVLKPRSQEEIRGDTAGQVSRAAEWSRPGIPYQTLVDSMTLAFTVCEIRGF